MICPRCGSSATHGHGPRRRRCTSCRRTWAPNRLRGAFPGRVTVDGRGRAKVYLGRSTRPVDGWRQVTARTRRRLVVRWVHPLANSGGWQYVSRAEVAAVEVRQPKGLPPWLWHAHHLDHDWTNDDPLNLQLCDASDHMFHHGRLSVQHRLRDERGRFLPASRQEAAA